MTLSTAGIAFIKLREGFRTHAYPDTKGIPTIGIGSTRYADGTKVKLGDVLTPAQALELFHITAKLYIAGVSQSLKAVVSPAQFDALVSFTYNIGVEGFKSSMLLRNINLGMASDKALMAAGFRGWLKNPELKGRREFEIALFNNGIYA